MPGSSRRHRLCRPLLEALEDRTLLSVYTVDRLTDTGDGSGLAGDLRYCITQATDGDVIDFAVQGTIMAAAPSGHAAAFELTHSISIQGPGRDVLAIYGYAFHDGRIFTVDDGATVDISGLTIAHGFSSAFTSDGRGGGILNRGTLTLSNMILNHNGADDLGGAIFNAGTLAVSNSALLSNGGERGGGIYNEGTLTVTNSVISGNGADYGGSAIASSGTLTLTDSTISANMVSLRPSAGGAVDAATGTIMNCIISGNISYGAAIEGTTLTIEYSTISGNTSDNPESAAGILNGGTMTVSNCAITGNTGEIGGIWNSGTLTVVNSTISGNKATSIFPTGGGIANLAYFSGGDAILTLLNCTVSGNTVPSMNRAAGQIYSGRFRVGSTGNGTVYLRNTLVSGHGAKPNFFADTGGTIVSQGHNLSDDDASGFLTGPGDLTNTDAMLGPLQDNGGPTQTMALLPGSPAVDAGDNTGAPDFDQRGPGFPRIIGGTIDIGAFEAQIGPATHLALSAPAQVVSGSPFDVTVTALDAYGHTATGYLGTVTFSSTDTDPGVVLLSDYTFSPDDQGVHTFVASFTLITPGDQTLTSIDTTSGITGSATVRVVPGPQAPPRRGARNNLRRITNEAIASVDHTFASMVSDEAELLWVRRSRFGRGHDVFSMEE